MTRLCVPRSVRLCQFDSYGAGWGEAQVRGSAVGRLGVLQGVGVAARAKLETASLYPAFM